MSRWLVTPTSNLQDVTLTHFSSKLRLDWNSATPADLDLEYEAIITRAIEPRNAEQVASREKDVKD